MEGMPTNEKYDPYSDAPFEQYGTTYNSVETDYKTAIFDELHREDTALLEEKKELFNLLPLEVRLKIKEQARAMVEKDNALKGI